jgi:hypothetical protein
MKVDIEMCQCCERNERTIYPKNVEIRKIECSDIIYRYGSFESRIPFEEKKKKIFYCLQTLLVDSDEINHDLSSIQV